MNEWGGNMNLCLNSLMGIFRRKQWVKKIVA